MQWLIDIIKEWVIAQGYLTDGFVDRGDTFPYDWTEATLDLDGQWHVLNVSTIVPAGARAILFRLQIKAPDINRKFFLRKAGHVLPPNRVTAMTTVADVATWQDVIVAVGDVRWVEYYAHPVTWSTVRLHIAGWWY